MFERNIDFLAVGDITTDAFIKLKEADIHCDVNKENCEICMKFGDKVPFEYVKVIKAVGNSANAAVSASRLGLKTSFVTNIGDDQNGSDCLSEMKKRGIDSKYVKRHANTPTNYHFVLWYNSDRTILVNHVEYEYRFPHISRSPKWLYLSSLARNSYDYHLEILEFLKSHPETKLAFQPGTFQMELGINKLKEFYARSEVFVCNVEESQRILANNTRDVKVLLAEMQAHGPKIVLITDGPQGAYMLDGDHFYYMPIYPDPKPPVERTGCGDAFASTFVSAMSMGKTPLEALVWAPVNPMSVVQYIGAQEGLLTLDQFNWWLERAPKDYKPKEI